MNELNFSGKIWGLERRNRAQRVRRVCETLAIQYGRPRFGNPKNPLDDLIYIILSNRTQADTAKKIYRSLKRSFPRWDLLLKRHRTFCKKILQPGGLSGIKTDQIRSICKILSKNFDRCTLNPLKKESEETAFQFLISLPGVSEKVAKCVMMYTLNFQVLPVDVHVYRITKRLGWNDRKRADQCHQELESLIQPKYRYAFHVDCIVHGRTVCKPAEPLCESCCINHYCDFYKLG